MTVYYLDLNVGTPTVTASDIVFGSTSQQQETIDPAASSLEITGYPLATTAGVSQTFTVTVLDASGNVDTHYTGTVQFSSSDPQSLPGSGLPPDYTFTIGPGGDNGVHTFTATLDPQGHEFSTVNDDANDAITGSQTGIVVNSAAASHLTIVSEPVSGVIAGLAFTITVNTDDPYGNVDRSYDGKVTVGLTSGSGRLTGTTMMAVTDGMAAFTNLDRHDNRPHHRWRRRLVGVRLRRWCHGQSGTRGSLRGDDDLRGRRCGRLGGYGHHYGQGPAWQHRGHRAECLQGHGRPQWHGRPSGGLARHAYVHRDRCRYLHVYRCRLEDGRGPDDRRDRLARWRGHRRHRDQRRGGTVLDLVVTTSLASTDLAGTVGTLTVTAFDGYNNPVASGPNQYEGSVDLSETDSLAAGLPSSYHFTAADAGSHTFHNVIMKTAGNQTITATDTVLSTIAGTTTLNVVPAAVSDFVVTTSFANPDVAGTIGTVTVTANDPYGNTVKSGPKEYLGTVVLTSTDPQAAGLPASHVFTANDAGTYPFKGVVLETAGDQTITATDSVTSSVVGTGVVTVVSAAAQTWW